jgi:enamine deaminase RidA (YjgF/YER057c/UK114 family)
LAGRICQSPVGTQEINKQPHRINKLLTSLPFAATLRCKVGQREKRMSIEDRIRGLGIEIPKAMAPVASYVPTVIVDGMLYTSGSGPIVGGRPLITGKLGGEVTMEQGYEAARLTAINLLALAREALGDLERIERVVKLQGFVASAPGFHQQPAVMDGASHLLEQVLEQRGRHARAAIGVNELPFDLPVEIDLIIKVKQ